MSKIILSKSKNKGKRFKVEMINFPGFKNMTHHFASDVGQTFIDHQDFKKKNSWISRHSVNKNWDNMHSGAYYSRHLLWNTSDLNRNIRILAKNLDTTIINRI